MRVTSYLISAFLIVTIISCNPNESDNVFSANGSVHFEGVDGGCWQIISDKEDRFTPMNLSEEYEVENLRVWIRAKFRTDLDPSCISGYVIEIN